jgi:Flp pilus assembly protein TadG
MRASEASFLKRFFKRLVGNKSGNALMIVALGLPMLIGGAGFGTDLAQWYMWKRELQFAADQGALAGAWAKASSKTAVQTTYLTRARQEYDANLSVIKDFDGADDPEIGLANYETGTNNSVVVTASVSKRLPFSSLLTNGTTTVSVRAQAIWNSSADFHACMLALDPAADQAFKMGNSVSGTSTCGAGALSDSDSSMKETGDNEVPLGTLVSAGHVDDTFSNNVNGVDKIYQNQDGLSDPYSEVTAPDPSGQPGQSYPSSCPVATPASTTYAANGTTKTHYTYKYYKGANSNNWTLQSGYSGTGYLADNWSTAVAFTNKSVTSSATTGLQSETTAAAGTAVKVTGNGGNAIWRVPYTSTQDTISLINTTYVPAVDGTIHLTPGVYSSLTIACTTEFSPGVYFVSGSVDFGQNQTVTGTGGVMFVLTGSAGAIHVNSNSNVTLAGISANTLINNYGYSSADAAKLAGMLIWDPDSTSAFTMNGNSTLHLSGIMYMPNREATFNGNSTASGNCMMVAAKTLKIEGNFSLNNFCVTTGGSAMSIGGTAAEVKLVA